MMGLGALECPIFHFISFVSFCFFEYFITKFKLFYNA